MVTQKQGIILGSLFAVIVLGAGVLFLMPEPVPEPVVIPAPVIVEDVVPEPVPFVTHETIGTSREGRDIDAYTYGTGEDVLLFVGGIHGGYEWNSTLLAYEMMEYLEENPALIPDNLSVHIIPVMNPDGLYAVIKKEGRFTALDVPRDTGPVGTGRFTSTGVDLNRNFDCKWQPESSWRGKRVSAGSAPFSEPEAVAVRDYVLAHNPAMVAFWHSKAGAVYASECHEGVLPETRVVMQTYADASGYRAVPVFDAYPITGDAEGWLASIGIPAITVEFHTHESIDWEENLNGVMALIQVYSI